MSLRSNAYTHADGFRWHYGDPDLVPAEAKLRDLAALRDAVEVLIVAHVEDARSDGLSWTRIGSALGMASEEATRQYDDEAGDRR
jgi:hypothetical protein